MQTFSLACRGVDQKIDASFMSVPQIWGYPQLMVSSAQSKKLQAEGNNWGGFTAGTSKAH